MNIQMKALTRKIIDFLWNDEKIVNNFLDPDLNMHRLVYDFLFKELQKETPTLSIQEYNNFVEEYNSFIDSIEFPETMIDKEGEEGNRELLFKYFLGKMKGFKFYQHGSSEAKTHQINTFWHVAIVTYFILSTVIKSNTEAKTKSINVLDITKFIPEQFGLDLDFETSSGLLLRYITDFQRTNPKFASLIKINGTAFTADDLTNYLCKTGYPKIQWLSSSTQVPDDTQLLYNAAIINTQNTPPTYIGHYIEDGQDYEIDFTKYENELKKAIDSTDQNHFIFTILPISIIFKEAIPLHDVSEYSLSKITDDIAVLRPKAVDWEHFYSLYSHYGLRINNIFCIDTVFSAPDSPFVNEPGMCVLFLCAENIMENDKVLLAEFENGTSLEEIFNIVRHKEKVKIGTWTETTTVFYLDQDTHFHGLIQDAYIRQCNKEKKLKLIKDGFKVYRGHDILQQVEKYIPQYDKDFQESSSSIYIPSSKEIFSCASQIGYIFEDYCNFVIESNIPLKLFDLTQIPWYQYLTIIYEHDSEKLEELKDEILKTRVGKEFNFDFEKFGLELDDDTISFDGKVVQRFTQSSRYIPLYTLIIRQIIKANTYQLILNPELVSVEYLKLLQWTELNSELLKKWLANCLDMDTAEAFNTLEFTLPSIENQIRIVSYNNHLDLGKNEIDKKKDALRYYLGGEFDFYESTYFNVDDFNFDIQPYKENEIQQLPQPIASLLYLDQCEENISRKNANLFHLFEAVANFHAVVCLSILKNINNPLCQSIIDSLVMNNLLRGLNNKGTPIQFAFGTWTSLLRTLIKNVEINKIPYFNISANKELISVLDDARILRNENSGHAPRMSEITEGELYTKLKNHCDKLINALLKVYGKYSLIAGPYQVIETSKDGSRLISCFKAMGNTPRFVNQKIRVYSSFDFLNHIIYLVPQTFHSVPIPILPFFSYMPLCEKDDKLQSLGYVHEIKMYHDSRVDERKITWYSYDCGDNNRSVKKYDGGKATKDLIDWLEPYWRKKF